MNNKFLFAYPLTKNGKHVMDLHISAQAIVGRENKILMVSIKSIDHHDKGGGWGTNVYDLIKFLSPELISEIEAATLEHAKEKYSIEKAELV